VRVTIGCPIRTREWVMPRWFAHTELAAQSAGVDTEYVFVGAADDPTRKVIEEHCPTTHTYVDTQERVQPDRGHYWSPVEYRHMVSMRNFLLGAVRQTEPDYFLSLDSDILLHEDALANMLETIQTGSWDAVGGKTWMTEAWDACSYIIIINSHGQYRPNVDTVIPVDVIMAIKLMSPEALAVNYVFDTDGEDVGWSRAATARGLKLAFDGRVCSRHVMYQVDRSTGKSWTETVDARCGF
jgi:hypothetical protein